MGRRWERSLPYDAILVDTSNPEMEDELPGTRWLDWINGLDALVKETETETQQLQQKQRSALLMAEGVQINPRIKLATKARLEAFRKERGSFAGRGH